MTGRHSKRGARARIPEQRLPGIELVDGLTGMVHQVSRDELLAGRARGAYLGFCGARVPTASMVDPGRGTCQLCRERATS
jgi:hypothetical protein